MSDAWRNELATEKQKEKLRFFGCTWDEGVTAGQASDALEECARQFPAAEVAYQKSQPATEEQKDKLRFFGCTWNGDITVGHASDALLQCARDFPGREIAWQKQKSPPQESTPTLQRATTIKTAITYAEARALTQEGWNNWIALHGSYGTEPGHKLTVW